MSFVDKTFLGRLGTLSREDADKCDYGIVKVDSAGKILLYNHYESSMAGVAASAAEGKNFFTEIAPCTNNRLFYGKFQQGVQQAQLELSFNYTFTYKMKPTNVAVQMHHDTNSNSNWIFVQKKAA